MKAIEQIVKGRGVNRESLRYWHNETDTTVAAEERRGGRAQAAAGGERGAAPGERDIDDGTGFLRIEVVVTFCWTVCCPVVLIMS